MNPTLLALDDRAALDPRRVGTKAAVLARMLQAGLTVPDGFVITADAIAARTTTEAVAWVAEHYAGVQVAVRSSALAEDGEDASFAGQYVTVLGVVGAAAIEEAVQRCIAAAAGVRAGSYHARVAPDDDGRLAILVQRLIEADAAGVAFGADPLTGDRARVFISAVAGQGASLVDGATKGEEWKVGAGVARPLGDAAVLTAAAAVDIAAQVRRAEDVLSRHPLDVEWAVTAAGVFVLQARPMTALPDTVTWRAPRRGGWFRGIRLGELLPEPLTPLFESWLLDHLERRFAAHQAAEGGFAAPEPWHVVVHGWYFHSPVGAGRQTLLLRGLLRRPRLALATVVATRRPDLAARLHFDARARKWPHLLLRYQNRVAQAQTRLERATPAELIPIVDDLAESAGDVAWSMVLFGGFAWRAEVALARFWWRHLGAVIESPQVLLRGLVRTDQPAHTVHSLDWVRRPLGARPSMSDDRAAERYAALAAARSAAEAACEGALLGRRRARRFSSLVVAAQRFARLREEHGRWFSLAWPEMRRCVVRLGEHLHARGLLERVDDVFFLTRSELDASLRGECPDVDLAARRVVWERQHRLTPPLVLGRQPFLLARLLLATPRFLRAAAGSPIVAGPNSSALHGVPASPGCATGRVKVLRDPERAAEVDDGDVLVVPVATPGLTPLFDRVVAVCADGGSVAAHASLIAREYGIPAVVGLGDATTRLRDGTLVTVDGGAGTVRVRDC